ncbi:MAG: TrmO family methyltransferase [Acidobacteriota bacterium]
MYLEDKDGMMIRFRVVGTVQTPFNEASGTPIQAEYGKGIEGRILVNDLFVPALDDIEGFERLWLIYWMDRVGPFREKVIPSTYQKGRVGTLY